MYNEIEGNLITLALESYFDVIGHGCNCFCKQASGIAAAMVENFKTDQFPLEGDRFKGDMQKLGCIDGQDFSFIRGEAQRILPTRYAEDFKVDLTVVNCYTQYYYGSNHPGGAAKPVDYEAITLCMRKLNKKYKGLKIGLPQIGAGLAKGDWNRIKGIIINEMKDCNVTVVIFKP